MRKRIFSIFQVYLPINGVQLILSVAQIWEATNTVAHSMTILICKTETKVAI